MISILFNQISSVTFWMVYCRQIALLGNKINICKFNLINDLLFIKLMINLINNQEINHRLKDLKTYIADVSENIAAKNYRNALSIIRNGKGSIKFTEYNPNSYVIDCLKAKNQKLKNQVKSLKEEKASISNRIHTQKKGYESGIKQCEVGIFISRFSLTIHDFKKVDYEDVKIKSDYQTITINSLDNNQKYQNFKISISTLNSIQKKVSNLLFQAKNEQNQLIYCFIKFQLQKECCKWHDCLNFGKIIQDSKNRKQLFLPESAKKQQEPIEQVREEDDEPIQRTNTNTSYQIMTKQPSSKDLNSIGKSNQKTERKFELSRPAPLVRVRGKSEHMNQSSWDISRISNVSNTRKASEDLFRSHLNQGFHGKMLDKMKINDFDDDSGKQSGDSGSKKLPTIGDFGMSKKMQGLIQKKKEFLHMNSQNVQKSLFSYQKPISWKGIEQHDDQNKSKESSIRNSNRSRDQSQDLSMSNPKEQKPRPQQNEVYQKDYGESVSPGFPQHHIVLRIHPIQRSNEQSSTQLPIPKAPVNQEEGNSQQQPSFNEDEQYSSQHVYGQQEDSDGHTSSEDNAARVQDLKKGIIVTKCAEKGIWPRVKTLYLSQNETQLCSRDLKDKKVKKIKISNIQSVEYQKFDKGIIKHNQQVDSKKCLLIKAIADDNRIKNYEFIGQVADSVQLFANNLKLFVEYANRKIETA